MAITIKNGTAADDGQFALASGDPSQAASNQSQLQAALNRGGVITLEDAGIYHILGDSFTYPTGTVINIAPATQFVANGSQIALTTLAPIMGTLAPQAQGYRTVLFGDSMVDTYETVSSGLSATYDNTTGVLTVSLTGHQQAAGWYCVVWNRLNNATIKGRRLAVASVVDANTITFNYGAGLGTLPTGSWFVRSESWRASQAFVPWLQAVSGQRFNIVRNSAQSGDTTQNALDRLESDCLAYQPQVVIMQMVGINDTSVGNGNVKESTIFANQCAIVDRILRYGARLILLPLTPVASGEARGTLTNMQRVIRLNQRLIDYCKTRSGVIVFDAYRRIVDPANATGLALTNYLRTADNIHYSMRGGRFIADQMWTQISAAFPSDNGTLPTSMLDNYWASALTLTSVTRSGGVVTATNTAHGLQVGERLKLTGGSESFNEYVTISAVPDANTIRFVTASVADASITGTILLGRSTNLVPNHLLTTATGGSLITGPTGTAAGNIRVENTGGSPTVVASVPARADGYGNNQQVVITAAAANNTVAISSDFTTYSTTLPAIIKSGRTYVAEFDLALSGVSGSNLTEILANIQSNVGGTVYQVYALNGYAEGANLNTDATSLHIRTAPMVLPSGTPTTMKWVIQFRFSALGTALTATIGRIALRESE